ncbi:Pkinase-domain-containing protein, partial [Neoconidiobolus thromboides FSU 785]
YQLIRTLGQGNYGQVYLVKDIMSNQKVTFPLKKIARSYDLKRDKWVEREIQICLLLNHPNIIHIKTYFKDEEYYYLIFEYIEGNSLATLLKKKKLKSKQINLYLFQLLDAITYCHYHSIVHRDLKIENIMITNTSQLKVIDFGLSNYFNITQKLTTYCGTVPYISPEIVKANCYVGPEVDIWSIGVILYAMCTRTLPFGNPSVEKNYYAIVTGQVNY